MKKAAAIILVAASLLFSQKYSLPATRQVSLPPLGIKDDALLLPLDSRPVCWDQPRKLAHLAGTNLILPPNRLLDNYRQPGDTEKLLAWLKTNKADSSRSLYISADMLLSGGLIASRQGIAPKEKQQLVLEELKKLSLQQKDLKLFSIIPRLLISDELIPDRWYKYKLLKYSQLQHQALITDDFASARAAKQYAEEIPKEVLNKYTALFDNSYRFNCGLLEGLSDNAEIIIGQDDGHTWGLPTLTAEKLTHRLKANPMLKGQLTYGADEIASVLIARSYLQQHKLQPKIYLQYGDNSIPNLHMPYMAASVEAVLQEKLKLLGALPTSDFQEADFILYINCGHDDYLPSAQQARQFKELLKQKPVALIDLSANFETQELLLPKLLSEKVPLNKLIAYGGWNTFSNSAGTALAQAAIIWGRLKESSTETELLALQAENLQLITQQLLDNYYYQKEYHWRLKKELMWRGVEPTNLTPKDKAVAEAFIQSFMARKARELLITNLGQTPFYSAGKQNYYLKSFSIKTRLPWNRIFEIDLQTTDFTIGLQEN